MENKNKLITIKQNEKERRKCGGNREVTEQSEGELEKEVRN